MPRRNSHTSDEEGVRVNSRRKKQKVNYAAVENRFDDIVESDDDEEEKHSGAEVKHVVKDEDEDDEEFAEFEERPRRTRKQTSSSPSTRRQAKKRRINDDEDDSFHEDESDSDENLDSESDAFASDFDKLERQREERQFISKDSEDDVDEEEDFIPDGSRPSRSKRKAKKSNSKKKKKSLRSSRLSKFRLRKGASHLSDDNDESDLIDDEDETVHSDNTLQQELAELRESDEERQLVSRSLRQRKKEVNYIIPPPLTDNLDGLPEVTVQPSTPRRRAGTNNSIRRLFPTGGPFGGGDVTSIFGKNYAGLSGAQPGAGNLLAGGADSDSSDDEIVPVGGKRSSISAPVAMSKTPKKKQNADSDPLGVDMNIDFSSIGGLDDYINQLKEMVALPLLYPEVYQKFGITPPRGVLFHGPPGTGKTLMARALAASCSSEGRNITFFMRKGADCLSKWVGEAERQLRLLFEEARKQQPSIIFFDEIDGLAPVRSSKQEQIHASIVSTLLALMDGMDNRGQVIVIGATNRPDAVDPALRRPGRFDREFYFPLPDLKAREQILGIHTKKWDPPLSKEFLSKVAHLTKGYGGADLRALCTEAALNSIQRRYPQIYQSNDKLQIDPDSIHVAARDFMKALDKIVPSSARSTSSGSAPLPEHLTSLLEEPLKTITDKLDKLVPKVKKLSALEEAEFVDPSENDADGGFGKHEILKRLEASRVHRPRLLIAGESGNGQQYLGSAVLNHLEGFNVQSLDLGQLFGDSTRTAENAIIQSFVEARRHKPSIIFIPNVDIWYFTVPESAKSTLAGLLRSVASNERILLLGVADTPFEELPADLKLLFGMTETNYVKLDKPSSTQRHEFFEPLWNALKMKPSEFLDNRKKRQLEKLKKLELPQQKRDEDDIKSFEQLDMKLKNTIKIKLAGLMDLFKNRYKRFKKPPIDDVLLIHLFEPVNPEIPQAYSRDGDMIVENTTGRRFFNMDLDVIEERLWNGFYSEPKQFLRDIEMIYKDAVVLNDRERLIKASEMYANAQVGVEEISTPEFIEQCKGLRQREKKRIREHEEKMKALQVIEEEKEKEAQQETLTNGDVSAVDPMQADQSLIEIPAPSDVLGEMSALADEVFENGHKEETPVVETQPEPTQEQALVVAEPVAEPEANGEKEKSEEEEEEEAEEEEEEPQPDPPFVLSSVRLEAIAQYLNDETEGLCVDELEQVNARLMDILWDDRHSWNRDATLEKISEEIVQIHKEFGL